MLTFLFRFRSLLYLSGILFFSGFSASAQKKLPEIVLSVDVREKSLEELLKEIAKKSGVVFSYNPKRIEVAQKVTYSCTDKSLTQILTDLSSQFDLSYSLVENQIILKPEKKTEKQTENVTLSGYIKDGQSGEALIGATVMIRQQGTGVSTNAFGFYSITLPKGSYSVECSFIGYTQLIKTIDLSSSLKEDVLLMEDPPVLEEVVVNGTSEDLPREIQANVMKLRPVAVEQRPALFGETDVVKSMESIPGIKMHSEGSTFYSVRGGNRDQNLILIDDAPVYNPSHLLGLFSTVIPDVVNDITLYKGDMPASLGGRLSSVLSVRTKKGNDQHRQVWGNVGLVSTKIGVEGPIQKDASSFFVSARVSRLKWIAQAINKDVSQFNFYDLTGKMNFRLNPKNHIFFSLYTSGDNYFASNNGISWKNTAATFRWNHLFNDRLFLNTTVAGSNYDYFLQTDVANGTRWNSHISNLNIKTDFSYFMAPQSELTFGLSINGYNFNPGNLQSNAPLPSVPVLSVRNSSELVLYANHELNLSDHWGLNYGIRLSAWSNSGESFEFIFDENRNPIDTLHYKKGEQYKKYVNIEPRVTLRYLLSERSSLKTSFSRNIQNVHLVTNSISPFTSLEVWLPSSINIKPEAANQFTLGYYRSLQRWGTSLVAETFYKKLTHQIDYESHAETLLNPILESELRFGSTEAYGIELQLKKDAGRLRGWTGYSYSRTQQKFNDLNQGKPFNAFYDRPHQINFVLTYDFNLRWNLGMNWSYSTGTPFSSPTSFYSYHGLEVPIYGQKNNDRLPDYHRLDLSATLRLNKNPENKFKHSLSISVYNFYARKNPVFVNYNKIQEPDGSFKIPSDLLDVTRVTSQFYLFRFSPSVSYNFKWR